MDPREFTPAQLDGTADIKQDYMSSLDYPGSDKVLTTKARKKLKASTFALPGRRYPLNNRAHAANALARVSQFGSPAEKAKVRSAVHKKYPSIGKSSKSKKAGRSK